MSRADATVDLLVNVALAGAAEAKDELLLVPLSRS